VFRLAMERGYLDILLFDVMLRPFKRLFQWCDAMERKWTDLLSGGMSRESDEVTPATEALERPI